MASARTATRQRLIESALDLFVSQGFTETTTRQIADLAQVNEVTLFRQFGSKHDLLLVAIQDSGIFARLSDALKAPLTQSTDLSQALAYYSHELLESFGQMPELLRSVVGEAGHYTVENRQALGQEIREASQGVANYLARLLERQQIHSRVPPDKLAGLLNGLLFGALVIELTTEFHGLWEDRQDLLHSLVQLCLYGAFDLRADVPPAADGLETDLLFEASVDRVADLPADLVRSLMIQAKKHSPLAYAITYLLFGSGLHPSEILILKRVHHISNSRQHLVQVPQGQVRQVPVNQWIMGKRYGSYTHNPLSQWLKSRKDEHPTLFVSQSGEPLTEGELDTLWQAITADHLTPDNSPPRLSQARQTWCVEMLMKGMELEDLSILSGWEPERLQPYARRAREKAALERAIQLDQKG